MRYAKVGIIVVLLGVLAVFLWQQTHWRQVDGRSAADWLTFARQAAYTVAYHAEGRTVSARKSVYFTLDQGNHGGYLLHLIGPGDHQCMLGNDGRKVWYQAGHAADAIVPATATNTPARLASRILGVSVVAEQSAVALAVHDGQTDKLIRLDRRTGVMLGMTTWFRHQVVSDMTVDTIAYHPVQVAACPAAMSTVMHPVAADRLAAILGAPPLRPRRLPPGFTLAGTFADICPCCGGKMAVLRYSDGLNTLTLFEMHGHTACACGPGCHITPGNNALVESRRLRDYTITAVANLDIRTLRRVLGSLKE